jgi:hypothetical protein
VVLGKVPNIIRFTGKCQRSHVQRRYGPPQTCDYFMVALHLLGHKCLCSNHQCPPTKPPPPPPSPYTPLKKQIIPTCDMTYGGSVGTAPVTQPRHGSRRVVSFTPPQPQNRSKRPQSRSGRQSNNSSDPARSLVSMPTEPPRFLTQVIHKHCQCFYNLYP